MGKKTGGRGSEQKSGLNPRLLESSSYSGVGEDLRDIIRRLADGTKSPGATAGGPGISAIDSSLLSSTSADFQDGLRTYFMDKVKQVQVGTSKRVIKQFHKNLQFADASCQTAFNDATTVRELGDHNNKLRREAAVSERLLAQERETVKSMGKKHDQLSGIIARFQTQVKRLEAHIGE